MEALTYEHFLLRAFSRSGHQVQRSGDLARIATTDIYDLSYNSHELNLVKVGTSYAMQIFYSEISNNSDTNNVSESHLNDMKRILDDVMSAQDSHDIFNLINGFTVYKRQYIR